MKKIIKTIPLFLLSFFSAQNVEVIYDKMYQVNQKQIDQYTGEEKEKALQIAKKLQSKKESFILKNNGVESSYLQINEPTKVREEVSESQTNDQGHKIITTNIKINSISRIFKNFKDKKILNQFKNHLGEYNINDQLPDIQWKITEEKKELEGYPVQKAIGNYNGNEIIAWYTDKIPVPDGPYYFQGLPGLIIHLKWGSAIYIASKISFPKEIKIEKPENNKNKVITFAELKKIEEKEQKQQEARYRTNPNSKTSIIKL